MVSVKIKEEIKVKTFELLRIRELRVRKTHVRMTRKRNHPLLSLSFISLQVLWLLRGC